MEVEVNTLVKNDDDGHLCGGEHAMKLMSTFCVIYNMLRVTVFELDRKGGDQNLIVFDNLTCLKVKPTGCTI